MVAEVSRDEISKTMFELNKDKALGLIGLVRYSFTNLEV